jgi:drug/metabolite transporter (DMT)-like permease
MAALRMTAREWGLLLTLSILWGGAFFLSSIAIKEMTPFGLAFWRVAIAALALGVALRALGLSLPKRAQEWRAFAMLAVVGNAAPFSLLAFAQTQITGGLAAILNAMTPIFTILLAHAFTRDEKITLRRLSGVLAGFLGVVTIVGPSALTDHGDKLLAEAAVLGAATCYAMAGVYGRRFGAYPPLVVSYAQLAVGTVMLLPLVLLAGAPFHAPAPSLLTIACVIAVAVFSTALAFGIYFRILRRAGSTNAALVTILVPVSAILLGAAILGDDLLPRHFAGFALIAIGLLVIDGRPLHYLGAVLGPARRKPDVADRSASPMLNEPRHLP